MIISSKKIKKARKRRFCCDCGTYLLEPHVSMYGYAHWGDKPYMLYACYDCALRFPEELCANERVRFMKTLKQFD